MKLWAERFCSWSRSDFGRKVWLLEKSVEKRKGKRFISVEEFSTCCNKLSKTHIEQLKALGSFAGMADTSQITLF